MRPKQIGLEEHQKRMRTMERFTTSAPPDAVWRILADVQAWKLDADSPGSQTAKR
jgi:hypothetical protein